MALTNYKIESLKPKDKLYQVADSGGLVLDILSTGSKVWRYRYRSPNATKQEKVTIGNYPEIGLADARAKHAELKKLVMQGISPAKQKQQQKTALIESDTVAEFANLWIEKAVTPHKKNYRNDLAALNNDILPVIGQRKIQDVTQSDIFVIIDTIQERGAATMALFARTVLKRLFDYAITRGKISINPVNAIKALHIGKVNHRDRVLTRAEITQFIKAVYDSDMAHSNKLALHLLLISMVRKCELTQAAWKEFDLAAGEWLIPAERMKKEKEHVVYLSRQAVKLLTELKQLAGHSDYVLPSRSSTAKHKTISDDVLNKAVRKLNLPFDGFVLHDFRRTASSHLHDAGFNSDAIEKALAHEQGGVRGVYNRAEYKEQRKELLQVWADFVDSLRTDNVLVLGNFKKAA